MIDYSIFDPTKQIWINLEFYFKSYDFYNFEDFFGIFLNLFNCIFGFKLIKKNKKGVLYYHALTWQSEAMWQLTSMCLCDMWTRVCVCVCVTCVRDVCAWHACVCVTRAQTYKWVRSIRNRNSLTAYVRRIL